MLNRQFEGKHRPVLRYWPINNEGGGILPRNSYKPSLDLVKFTVEENHISYKHIHRHCDTIISVYVVVYLLSYKINKIVLICEKIVSYYYFLGAPRTEMRVCSFEDEEKKSPSGQFVVKYVFLLKNIVSD